MKIAIIGACGKMGKTIAEVAKKQGIEIVGACESQDCPFLGKDYGEYLFNEKNGVQIVSDFENAMMDASLGIEFTNRTATLQHLKQIRKINKPYLTGTTGFAEEDFEEFKKTGREIPIFWSPNMSYGVNVVSYLLRICAKYLSDWDFEIVEIHHTEKKDAPSGTAKIFANILEKHSEKKLKRIYAREGISKREKNEIGIFALRMGDVKGEHRVFFATEGERIEISHIAYSREIFAKGALKVGKWLLETKKPGFYSMEDFLGIR